MSKIKAEDWVTIRSRREVGESFPSLGKAFNVSYQAIQKRANRENWGDGSDLAEAVKSCVNRKVVGVVVDDLPEVKAAAVEQEASRIYEIKMRHREQCQILSDEIDNTKEVENNDPILKARIIAENRKNAKLLAEALRILHEIESRAWDMPEKELDFTKMTRDQIREVAAGKMPR